MTRRELWLSIALVGTVALAVRVVAAALVPFPVPEDTAYYYGVARNLVEGRGLVTDALWTFQAPPLLAPPRPAFDIWMPLPTLLAAIPMSIFGTGYRAAQTISVLAGTLVPILTWRLAWDVATERGLPASRRTVLAIGAGLTAAVELPLLLHSTLLDSTAIFAVFVLAACLVMSRLLARPAPETWSAAAKDPRLLGLGVLIGLAALTRSEAVLLGASWALLVVFALARRRAGADPAGSATRSGTANRALAAIRLIAVPAVVALVILLPWAIRNVAVLGSPFPSQTLTNALSVSGFDIFAFQDPPTVSRYLAIGPARLLQIRVDGLVHNILTVLLIPSFPVGLIGLIAVPWFGRGRALRPLLLMSGITLAFTTLVFPVSTTWGTYLHAAGAAHVLLIISCLFALDALIVRVGRFRHWTRPVAWLGPALTIAGAALFAAVFVPSFGRQSSDVEARYAALPAVLAAAGLPAMTEIGAVISDHPIWWAEAERSPALGLPNESPSSVLALARAMPGTRYLIISSTHGNWPEILKTDVPDTACFREVTLTLPTDRVSREALRDTHVFELVCP